jgi:thiopeptide-type bacteriocin biosynthesis protein
MSIPNTEFHPLGWFVLRTPLLSFDQWIEWSKLSEALPSGRSLDELERNYDRLKDGLKELLNAAVREALFLSSSSLGQGVEEWLCADAAHNESVESSVAAIFARMSGRATPFGVSAGFSLGLIKAGTMLQVPAHDKDQRCTQIDVRYLVLLAEQLFRSPEFKNQLTYHPSSCLWRVGKWLRVLRPSVANGRRDYTTVNVELTDGVKEALECARNGCSREEIIARLCSDPLERWAADEFVDELIESSVLVPVGCPFLTSDNPARQFIELLRRANGADVAAETLGKVLEELRRIDQLGVGCSPEDYRNAAKLLRSLIKAPELSTSQLFHVDLMRPVETLTLSGGVISEITDAFMTLVQIAPPPEDDFAEFRRMFQERFEDAEVPLLRVLDPEIGIGFADSDVSNQPLGAGGANKSTPPFTRRDGILIDLVRRSELDRQEEISLTPETITLLRNDDYVPVFDSFSIFVTLFADSAAAVDRGECSFSINGYVPTMSLFGRFSGVNETLRNHLRELAAREEAFSPDAVLADVIHHPAGEELGNILRRNSTRKYEIPVLGSPNVPPEFQIHLEDLLISVIDGRVVLRSRRLNKIVVPRIGNAHTYRKRQNLPIYRFLGALQSQGRLAAVAWNWGPVLNSLAYLPRLRYGKLILSAARWVLCEEELQRLTRGRTPSERFQAMTALRSARRLPRYVLLQDGDQRLPVDLQNIMSVNSVVRLLTRRTTAVFIELIGTCERLCTEGPGGRYQHELNIPFVREIPAEPQQHVRSAMAQAGNCQRRFPPGSEWVYLKIYSGPSFLEEILLDDICPEIQQLESESVLKRWFFVRYYDGNHHLRLRFQGRTAKEAPEIMARITSAISRHVESLDCWRIQADTYIRETDRYGGTEGVQCAEEIFHADSKVAISALSGTVNRNSLDERLLIGMAGINRFLDNFNVDLAAKIDFSRAMGTALHREFNSKAAASRTGISQRYRNMRKDVDALVTGFKSGDQFAQRSANPECNIERIKGLERTGKLMRPVSEILASINHMCINRLFQTNQRFHEYIAYEMLFKTYQSIKSRSKRGNSIPSEMIV